MLIFSCKFKQKSSWIETSLCTTKGLQGTQKFGKPCLWAGLWHSHGNGTKPCPVAQSCQWHEALSCGTVMPLAPSPVLWHSHAIGTKPCPVTQSCHWHQALSCCTVMPISSSSAPALRRARFICIAVCTFVCRHSGVLAFS